MQSAISVGRLGVWNRTLELLNTAQEMLVGNTPASAVRPGQVRLVVASLKAPFGPPLAETAKVEVTLTVDAGSEDAEVKAQQKAEGLRQGRIPWPGQAASRLRNRGPSTTF